MCARLYSTAKVLQVSSNETSELLFSTGTTCHTRPLEGAQFMFPDITAVPAFFAHAARADS